MSACVVVLKLENKLQRYLANSRIGSCPQGGEVSVADGGSVIHRSFITEEIHLVEYVEEFAAQLHLKAFGYGKGLRDTHIPAIKARESQGPFSDITERVLQSRIGYGFSGVRWIWNIGRHESGRIEPGFTRCRSSAGA